MADNFNTQVAEALLRHDIDLARLDAGNARRIQDLFRSLSREVADQILAKDPTETLKVQARNKKLKQLISVASKTIEEGYEALERISAEELTDVVQLEAGTVSATVNETIGVELMSGRLNKNVVKRLADNTLIEGAPSRDWWKGQKQLSQRDFVREMRAGVLLDEPVQELVRRIRGRRENGFKDGLMSYNSKASRQAQALARSSIMSVANAARFETYVQNKDVVKGVQWLSTLDKRTTDICIALDGQAWTLDGKRLPGTQQPWRGPPPAHWNCRSTLTPVLRSWSDLITNKKARKKVLAVEKSGKLSPGWRASMNGRVSADLKYMDWLNRQPKSIQIDVLGKGRYDLWKEGKLKARDLISQTQEPFTLKQLTDKLVKE